MKINDLMTKKLIVCDYDDTVLFVSNLMKQYDVGFILVMKDKKLRGVVTDRDLVCNLAEDVTIIDGYITKNVISIDENEDVKEALNLMKNNKIKRLVITNDNKITGVLSLSDLLNANIDNDKLLETLRVIYKINRNDSYFEANVNDYIL